MVQPIPTTLNAIRAHSPCEDGWEKLLKYLGKTKADDEPLRFSTILKSNGVDHALWCLRSLGEEHYPRIRLLVADYAERVLHLYEAEYEDDDRPRKAIQAARDYANGRISEGELAAAKAAAWAAKAAARAARAAWTAEAAAGAAARAAWAAEAAAGAAARAAWAAARAARAAWAAEAAAGADARDAWAAEAAAEKEIQGELLIKYFG